MYRGGTVAIAERANTKMEMTEAENFELDIISEFVSIWDFEKWHKWSPSENPYYFYGLSTNSIDLLTSALLQKSSIGHKTTLKHPI